MKKCFKIFIIEDDDAIRQTFSEILESEGYTVESFENGKTALDKLYHEDKPCLIFLDMMMPVMDGGDFMKAFNKLSSNIANIPVYLCSAGATKGQAEKIGCNGFIKKPVDLNSLLDVAETFCSGVKKQL